MRRDSILAAPQRSIFSSLPPCPRGFSVTGTRTAGRASTYCTANPTEGCPDRSAAPGIPGNRSDKGAPGGASSGTPDGARGNGLAGGREYTCFDEYCARATTEILSNVRVAAESKRTRDRRISKHLQSREEYDSKLAVGVSEFQSHEATAIQAKLSPGP